MFTCLNYVIVNFTNCDGPNRLMQKGENRDIGQSPVGAQVQRGRDVTGCVRVNVRVADSLQYPAPQGTTQQLMHLLNLPVDYPTLLLSVYNLPMETYCYVTQIMENITKS